MPTAAKDIFRQPGVPMRAGRPLDLTPGAIVPAHAAALIKAAQMRQARLRPQPQGPGAGRPRDGHLIQRPIHIARPVPAHLLPGVQTGPTVYPVAPEPPQELPYVDSGTSGGLSGGLSGDFTEGQTLADDDRDDIGATADDQGLITDSGALLADADSDTALEPSEYADQAETAVERGIFDRLYAAYQSGQLTLDSDGDNTTGGQDYSFNGYGYDYGNQGGAYYGYYGDYGSGTAARYGLYGAGASAIDQSEELGTAGVDPSGDSWSADVMESWRPTSATYRAWIAQRDGKEAREAAARGDYKLSNGFSYAADTVSYLDFLDAVAAMPVQQVPVDHEPFWISVMLYAIEQAGRNYKSALESNVLALPVGTFIDRVLRTLPIIDAAAAQAASAGRFTGTINALRLSERRNEITGFLNNLGGAVNQFLARAKELGEKVIDAAPAVAGGVGLLLLGLAAFAVLGKKR